jgi:hypothetical protein
MEQRIAPRHSNISVELPFTGTIAPDAQPFQFLLLDISHDGTRIAIPPWSRAWRLPENGELVNLHLPLHLQGSRTPLGRARILWQETDKDLGLVLGTRLDASPGAGGGEKRHTFPVRPGRGGLDYSQAGADQALMLKLISRAVAQKCLGKSRVEALLIDCMGLATSSAQEDAVSRVRRDMVKAIKTLDNLYLALLEEFAGKRDITRRIHPQELDELLASEMNPDQARRIASQGDFGPVIKALRTGEEDVHLIRNTLIMMYANTLTVRPPETS